MAAMMILMVALMSLGAHHGYVPSGETADRASELPQSSGRDDATPNK